MDMPYLGTVLLWAPTFAPKSWAYCAGQLISISQNQALFALIGTTYGGNGVQTFALPDLRSRVPVGGGMGAGPGLSDYSLGEMGGISNVMLLVTNMPFHNHSASTLETVASAAPAETSSPATGQLLASPNTQVGINTAATKAYAAPAGSAVPMALGTVTGMTAPTGGAQPFNNDQPYLGVGYIICLEGIFPPQS